MKLIYWLSILTSIPYQSIATANPTSNVQGCIEPSEVDYTIDYFPEKITVDHSEHWSISYHNWYKIVTNSLSNVTYLLYQCGTAPPSDQLDGRHHVVVPVPLPNGVALTGTAQIPHMELLGLRRQISAYIGNHSYISSPCVNHLINTNDITLLDDDETQINEWLSENQHAIILGDPWDNKTLPQRVILSESEEKSSNQAIFEWHKLYGAFFNLEAMATDIFEKSNERYQEITTNAAIVVDDEFQGEKPTVLWAYYSSYNNGWDVAECPNYYCDYAKHCSATLLTSNAGSVEGWMGRRYMTDEEFLAFGKDAEYWFYPSPDWDFIYVDKTEMLDQFVSVRLRRVYDYQGCGPNSWFEERFAEYDVVLHDFCSILGVTSPTDSFLSRQWFRNVHTELPSVPGQCDVSQIDAPLDAITNECTIVQRASDDETTSDASAEKSFASIVLLAQLLLTVSALFL